MFLKLELNRNVLRLSIFIDCVNREMVTILSWMFSSLRKQKGDSEVFFYVGRKVINILHSLCKERRRNMRKGNC